MGIYRENLFFSLQNNKTYLLVNGWILWILYTFLHVFCILFHLQATTLCAKSIYIILISLLLKCTCWQNYIIKSTAWSSELWFPTDSERTLSHWMSYLRDVFYWRWNYLQRSKMSSDVKIPWSSSVSTMYSHIFLFSTTALKKLEYRFTAAQTNLGDSS